MWSEVAGRLYVNGLFAGLYRSRFCLNAVTRLHTNGAAERKAARTASVYTPTRPRTWRRAYRRRRAAASAAPGRSDSATVLIGLPSA
jgi:hypothetical protein